MNVGAKDPLVSLVLLVLLPYDHRSSSFMSMKASFSMKTSSAALEASLKLTRSKRSLSFCTEYWRPVIEARVFRSIWKNRSKRYIPKENIFLKWIYILDIDFHNCPITCVVLDLSYVITRTWFFFRKMIAKNIYKKSVIWCTLGIFPPEEPHAPSACNPDLMGNFCVVPSLRG